MAARLNPKQDERSRSAIQTTQLCKRLSLFVLGEKDPATKKLVEMSAPQVTAALGLLKKTLPDLSAVDQTTTHEAGDSIAKLLEAVGEKRRAIPTGR